MREFLNIKTNDVVRIMESYQNVGITDKKEKVDMRMMSDPSLFMELKSSDNEYVNSSDVVNPDEFINRSRMELLNKIVGVDTTPTHINESNAPSYINSEKVDPADFDNRGRMELLNKIMSVDISSIPFDEENVNMNVNVRTSNDFGLIPNSNANESLIIQEPYDEAEEIMRKYNITTPQNALTNQTKAFEHLLDNEDIQEIEVIHNNIEPVHYNTERPQQIRQEHRSHVGVAYVEDRQPEVVKDPITIMFKNIKRNLPFSIEILIEDNIPRLDFIEMMEDSYETSIIEYLADEFTNKLLNDPNQLRNKIIDKIRTMISEKNGDVKKTVRKTKKTNNNDTPTIS